MGMTQAEFARQLGWPKARLNELIRGKPGITAEILKICWYNVELLSAMSQFDCGAISLGPDMLSD